MASFRFELLKKSKSATIYFRVSIKRGITPRVSTGLFIDSKEWNTATNLPRETTGANKNLKTKLQKLSTYIEEEINKIDENGGEDQINGKWLKHKIDVHFGRIAENKKSELVTDAIQNIIDTANIRKNAHGGIGLSKSRVNSYKSLKKGFERYQKDKSKKIKVKSVGVAFGNDFLDYLVNNEKYSEGYALKFLSDLKTACMDAETNEIPVHSQLSKISAPRPESKSIIYLTPAELEKIENADLSNDSLKNARKWLLLGCNIGQRGGDLLSIGEGNFVTRNGYEVIELKQKKTGKNVTIPVLETTKKILETGLPYKISIQKLNDYIKDVCEIAEINEPTKGGIVEVTKEEDGNTYKRKVYGTYPKHELITTHVCRRSFCTNLYGVLPTPLIMSITAHSTEKMFLNYIGKDSLDYAQQIADFYTLQAQKAKKETNLKVVKKSS